MDDNCITFAFNPVFGYLFLGTIIFNNQNIKKMNAERRKQIDEMIKLLQDVDVQIILDEEQEYYDNMPEGLQSGERGDKANEAISSLESAMSAIEEAIDYLESAKD